jgi:hypothetical protein
VSASHQGAEHGDRRVGKRGLHLAQRCKRMTRLRETRICWKAWAVYRTPSRANRQAGLVQGIDRNAGNTVYGLSRPSRGFGKRG